MIRIIFFISSLIWMGVIYYLSSIPELASDFPVVWDTVLRKIFHVFEYALLAYLISGALEFQKPRLVLAAAFLYAISDEWHQGFVMGRQASVIDVGIDTIGIIIAILLIQKNRLFRRFFVSKFI